MEANLIKTQSGTEFSDKRVLQDKLTIASNTIQKGKNRLDGLKQRFNYLMAPKRQKEAAAKAALNRKNGSDDEGSPQKKRGGKKELDETITTHPGLRSVVE